jgi:hypothetical protein
MRCQSTWPVSRLHQLPIMLWGYSRLGALRWRRSCAYAYRWGFWKRLGTHKEKPLLPDGHRPSSPASQHTLIIQEPGKPEGSSPSRQFGSGPSSVFASPTAQQQQQQHRLGVSRLNSELSRKPGSGSVVVQRRSTDMGGVAGSVAARAAAPAAGSAAAVTSDPLLAPGVLEAVNLRVDGKAVSDTGFMSYMMFLACDGGGRRSRGKV